MKKVKFAYLLFFALIVSALQNLPTSSAEPVSVRNDDVEIFVTSWCPFCRALENYLREKRVPCVRHDIEEDMPGREKYLVLGGGGYPLIRIGNRTISGFDEYELDEALMKRTKQLKSCNFTC